MAKCENCADNASFSVENPGAQHQAFCKEHLPKVINQLKLPAYVKTIDAAAEKPAAPKKKKTEETTPAPVEVEAVAEVVEETPEVTE